MFIEVVKPPGILMRVFHKVLSTVPVRAPAFTQTSSFLDKKVVLLAKCLRFGFALD